MKIALCCDWDNGGQMAALWKALNRYTEHKARLITFRRSYLGYEEDLYNPPPAQVEELCDWAEFFVLGEVLQPSIQSDPIYHRIRSDNCIVRAAGSIARNYPNYYTAGKIGRIMKTGTYHDSTIVSRIYPMAHTVNMYHFDEWPQPLVKVVGERPLKIVLSGTALKQTMAFSGAFMEAWSILRKRYDESQVQLVNIRNTPWAETLRIKSGCDICYDQVALGFYGSTSVEGMYYRMPTFNYIDGWCKSIHPDLPLISLRDGKAIYEKTVSLIEDKVEDTVGYSEYGAPGREYCLRVHDAKVAVQRWVALIDYVVNDFRKEDKNMKVEKK